MKRVQHHEFERAEEVNLRDLHVGDLVATCALGAATVTAARVFLVEDFPTLKVGIETDGRKWELRSNGNGQVFRDPYNGVFQRVCVRRLERAEWRVAQLKNWSMRLAGTNYHAPEIRPTHLCGTVTGSHKFADGSTITTSAIVSVHGRLIRTQNGSTYRLGQPHPSYSAWLAAEGIPYDKLQPVKVHGGEPWLPVE